MYVSTQSQVYKSAIWSLCIQTINLKFYKSQIHLRLKETSRLPEAEEIIKLGTILAQIFKF